MNVEDYTPVAKYTIFKMGSSNAIKTLIIPIEDLTVEVFLNKDPDIYLYLEFILRGRPIAKVKSYVSNGINSIKFKPSNKEFAKYEFWLTENSKKIRSARVGLKKLNEGSRDSVLISSNVSGFNSHIEEFISDLQCFVGV